MHLTEFWDRHQRHLQLRRRSAYTLVYYRATYRAVEAFLRGAGHSLEAEAVGLGDLREFLAHLHGRGLSEGGIDAHFRALRGIFGWATGDELLERDPTRRLERPSKPVRLPPTLGVDEYRRLLATAKKGPQGVRDTALLVLLFDTGIRLDRATRSASCCWGCTPARP